MDILSNRYVQYRSFEFTYFAKIKPHEIVIKICDLAQRQLHKSLIRDEASINTLQKLKNDPVLFFKTVQKLKIDFTQFNFPSFEHPLPDLETCHTYVKDAIADIKSQIATDHPSSKQFICPISMDVLKDPVITNCGHTFEKENIEEANKKNTACPTCRTKITSLSPNYSLKSALETWEKEDPIPTFSSFQKDNKAIAQAHLSTAQTLIEGEAADEAISSYKKAFQYTKGATDYAPIPKLYQSLQKKPHERLAHLYYALYLLEENNLPAAVTSLESAQSLESDLLASLSINFALIMLYRHTHQEASKISQLIQDTLPLLKKTPSKKGIFFAKEMLCQDLTHTGLYDYLADVTQGITEQRQFLFKGALHALTKQQFLDAETLCAKTTPQSFEELVIFAQANPSSQQERLEKFALQFFNNRDFKKSRQAFKTLLLFSQKPLYYEKIIDSYSYKATSFFSSTSSCFNLPKSQPDKKDKIFPYASKLIELYIAEGSYRKVERIAENAIKATTKIEEKIEIYKKLELVYLNTGKYQLQDLWKQLGGAYEETCQIDRAKEIYEKCLEQFNTQFFAFKLADILILQKKPGEAVAIYYSQAEKAICDQDKTNLEKCYSYIQKIDPSMRLLDPLQKMQLLSQRQILKLSTEFKEFKESSEHTISSLQKELEAQKRSSEEGTSKLQKELEDINKKQETDRKLAEEKISKLISALERTYRISEKEISRLYSKLNLKQNAYGARSEYYTIETETKRLKHLNTQLAEIFKDIEVKIPEARFDFGDFGFAW